MKATPQENRSSTAVVKTQYTMNSRKIDPSKRSYNLTIPKGKLELNINKVRIQIGDNISDVKVTEKGINIMFK